MIGAVDWSNHIHMLFFVKLFSNIGYRCCEQSKIHLPKYEIHIIIVDTQNFDLYFEYNKSIHI